MKLKLTLVRPGPKTVDVAVTAEPTTPVADIAREIFNADPTRQSAPIASTESVTLRLHQATDLTGSLAGRIIDCGAALADSNLASGSVVSLVTGPPAVAGGEAQPVGAKLTLTNGPDAGRSFTVPVGSSTVGREAGNRVVLKDPLVSKVHLRINVTDAAEIIDVGSANGTFVNGELVDRAVLAVGDIVTVGDSGFRVEVVAQAAAAERGGIVQLNRSPRLDPRYPGRKFKSPEAPEHPQPQRLPWLALFAPLLMGVVLYFATRSLLSVVFIGLSPLLMIGTYVDNRIQNKRQWKQAKSDFEAAMHALERSIDEEHSREKSGRLCEAPSVAEIMADTFVRGPLVWTRRPEHEAFLALRLGLAVMPSRVELQVPNERKGAPELWSFVEAAQARAATVADVPVVERFTDCGNIGIAGTHDLAGDVARGIVAQLVGLHSPAELVLVSAASTASAATWDWLKWLPHVGSVHSPLAAPPLATGGQGIAALVSELEGLVESRSAESDNSSKESSALPIVILLVEDDAPFERARLVSLAEHGPAVGVHLIWVAASLARLPAACRTFLEVSQVSGAAVAGYVHSGIDVQSVSCEAISEADAMAFARSIAPLVDAGARVDDSSDLPRSVSLLHVLGADSARDPNTILNRWQETNSILTGPRASKAIGKSKSTLRAVFGQAAAEPFAIDLRSDGPHALIGGTTGSGKSEFLQAWVLALAASHSPQRVSFLFVDYKGGSAFADCVNLPHTVGLVTDLTQHLVQRALTSLRAELHYREQLLQRKKLKDLEELERSGDTDVPPSLIIIVDEFAALVNEVPDFVDGVVDVAQRGRSLGLHLILATQRPAGVIRDNLRANTNLRVALRMADEDDSTDVLGMTMAANFDPGIPGRAAAKTGPGRIRAFQSGYAGGWTSDEPEPSHVVVEELRFGLPLTWDAPVDPAVEAAKEAVSKGPTDIKRLVSTVREAARLAEIPQLRKPWLPVLASSYDFSMLPNKRTDEELLLGVVDDAARQAQPTISYYPDRDGNMAIIGTGGSGKSTTLRSIAIAAAVTMRGGPVRVYGLDYAGGGLQMLQPLPHVGAIIAGDDEERVARLLRMIRDEVDQRAVRYSAARAGNIRDYRVIAKAPDEPRILLLLDGLGAFRDAYESSVSAPWFSVFSQIATDGRQVGVHVIVTGDRSGAIPTSLSSSIQRRLVLRMANVDDYGMLGIDADVLGPVSPPGRGVLDDQEVQVAVLGGDPNVAVQARKIEELADSMRKAGLPDAPPIERLPDDVSLSELPPVNGNGVVIGIADDSLAPIGIEPHGGFVIAGPPGSGRTTALWTLAAAVHRADPSTLIYLFSPRRSRIARWSAWTGTAATEDAVAELVSTVTAALKNDAPDSPNLAIFIENLAEFTGQPTEYALETVVKLALKREQFVVAETETSTWSQAYTLGTPLRAGRRGLLLQPDDSDGDMLLNTATGRVKRNSFPVGRGFFIAKGRARKVQVAASDVEEARV